MCEHWYYICAGDHDENNDDCFDGGLKQMFKLDVRDAVTGFPLLNMSQVAELINQSENSIN